MYVFYLLVCVCAGFVLQFCVGHVNVRCWFRVFCTCWAVGVAALDTAAGAG